MTALGAINQESATKDAERLLRWWGDPGGALATVKDVLFNSTLSGSVSIGGTPQANIKVSLCYRRTGRQIKQTLTDASGDFSFTDLPAESQGYYIIAQTDDAGGYNALIYDKLTPA